MAASAKSVFDAAVKDFQDELLDRDQFDFRGIETIDDVYKEIDRIQEEQGRNGMLRNMKRIEPFLACLEQYSEVLDTFVQAKANVLALIWGPIKFLLQVSRNYVTGFDKVVEMTVNIGHCLPQFKKFEGLFKENKGVRDVLYLFYKDILDFYGIMLRFFQTKGWKPFFEALWPRFAAKIAVVMKTIEKHESLLHREVILADIQDARTARARALDEYERSELIRERQNFEACKLSLAPRLYDQEMERMRNERCKDTCTWLGNDEDFQTWFNSMKRSSAFLWLSGIPGAGQYRPYPILPPIALVLDTYSLYATGFPAQAYVRSADFPAVILDLQSFADYNQQLLTDLLQCIGVTYIVLDGLDEISEKERHILLKGFLQMSNHCPELKVMVSSREETDISSLLRSRALSLRIDLRNSQDIKLYFNTRVEEWLDTLEIDDDTYSSLKSLLQGVPQKAEGMFLYAKLVIENLKSQLNLSDIRREAANLPTGLDQAYGRIIARIEDMQPSEQFYPRTILAWVSCSKATLRKQEIIQALMIHEEDSSLVTERRILKNIGQLCGPIIEFDGELVSYVHFTAKE
ncbi:MAG: hypothetical protein ASARMPREDX12_008428 [Alectoria sarmentosa]|nr:MAG: hypothetical protein ASARMPREDX12_008428 [Alectoria sarmentosa]